MLGIVNWPPLRAFAPHCVPKITTLAKLRGCPESLSTTLPMIEPPAAVCAMAAVHVRPRLAQSTATLDPTLVRKILLPRGSGRYRSSLLAAARIGEAGMRDPRALQSADAHQDRSGEPI